MKDNEPIPPVSADELRNILRQQETAELKACWENIQAILDANNAELVPVITLMGASMQGNVVIRKKKVA